MTFPLLSPFRGEPSIVMKDRIVSSNVMPCCALILCVFSCVEWLAGTRQIKITFLCALYKK